MIVIDSSALVAILFEEPERQPFQHLIDGSERCIMSAVNAQETASVLRVRHGQSSVERLWVMLVKNEVEIIPFDETQMRTAVAAFSRYGKGIDPKARLNMGDCAAYALAKTMNAPLLFKGNDFTHTDLRSALV